ncbi:sulfatase-like hydrolase/transferase [Pseudodesulfovibrio sp. JC047]|uniref:arylsulfatase n=1 Tax=Pseudodesulfovibrio sp. JC047 TaxID=2683199 RepID=UPI0013D27169|nr:arylsulfatase [Pseudodesulfovibrio sp. JC047]NDV20213.1 sulfatase-like hydrolase/transferase [Pseudodesulfovibrio sp. JC047]
MMKRWLITSLCLMLFLALLTACSSEAEQPEEKAVSETSISNPSPTESAANTPENPDQTATEAASPATIPSTDKPNIVVIWGDDIGQSNLSAYTRGVMGYTTPNIDRVAHEGMIFTDYYAEQSCTAGRSAFITGQSVYRTGLSKVGMPGAELGMNEADPTIAELLKNHGYATAQFGKNHLGDRDIHLPTNHGFDEFYGNLYHLNAEEEPEHPDYPKPEEFPNFKKNYGPRGVIHSYATADGQKIEDTGPLTKKRMETIDEDVATRSAEYILKQAQTGDPFFVWVNFTHMHFRTYVPDDKKGQAGRWQSIYHDAMVQHDKDVGIVLDAIDEAGIADNTIVFYSTDNGPHKNTWPDAGTSPFRNEKNSNWEGAYRVPAMVRWPGHIQAGAVSNDIISHLDWMPTLLAAAGETDVKEKLLTGHSANGKEFKVHLDGYNFLPYLTGQNDTAPRKDYFYFSDDGDLTGLRYDNWKIVFAQQRAPGSMLVWGEPLVNTRIPWLFNLRTDPYEQATITSNTYWDWYLDHAFLLVPAQGIVGDFLGTFQEYPPRMKAASFTIDQIMEKLTPPTQ